MIHGVHTMFYTSATEKLQAFLRDQLGFPATDVEEGWLTFDLPEADIGRHTIEPRGVPSAFPDLSFLPRGPRYPRGRAPGPGGDVHRRASGLGV